MKHFIEQNLQSTVGYWTEEEVEKKALQWNSARNASSGNQPSINGNDWQSGGNSSSVPPFSNTPQAPNANVLEEKRKQAKNHIAGITTIDDAKALLNRLCDECGELLLDMINS